MCDQQTLYFRVYKTGKYPHPKKHYYPERFEKRQKARKFCRNRSWEEGLTIVHPNGEEEKYQSTRGDYNV